MTAEKGKMEFPGLGDVEGEFVNAIEKDYPPVSAELEDGTKITFKHILVKAFRTSNKYDAKGNPGYAFQFGVEIVSVDVPEKLQKKGE